MNDRRTRIFPAMASGSLVALAIIMAFDVNPFKWACVLAILITALAMWELRK
jgi:hypothetical protein